MKYYNKNNELLPSIDTLFIPDDFFITSKNMGDASIEWFLKYCDKDEVKKYEYYSKCIKNRGRNYLKRWVKEGYPLVDLLFSGIFDDYACRSKQDMEQLRYESMLGKHYLS